MILLPEKEKPMESFLLVFLGILLAPALASAQSESPESHSPKVCVAIVSNASAASAPIERLTERLVKNLKRGKTDALAMDSSTTMSRKLELTRQNSGEADTKRCDYTLLTQIVENRAHPAAPATLRPGGPIVPSVDASDSMGGSSGPVYREEIQISFALFRSSRPDPLLDTAVLERASANVSDTFMAGMDRIANRVNHELKKK
jgi:hypothetical protein